MKITKKMRKLKKRQRWSRFPTPDCPVCEGTGTMWFGATRACDGRLLFGGMPISCACNCVRGPGKRPSLAELEKYRREHS